MTNGNEQPILRHTVTERVTHWAVAIVFLFLFFSGLALFHPVFFWLSALLGGGPLMRVLHPFAGAVLAVLFAWYAAGLARDNRWLATDREWVQHMGAYMQKEFEPRETHKYNAGQKLMYWSMIPIIAVLLLSGIVLWQPYFAPAFPPGLRRLAGLLHAVTAFIMFVGIGIHVYAAYWTRGSIRGMVRGSVSRAWAKFHCPAWYREMMGKGPGA